MFAFLACCCLSSLTISINGKSSVTVNTIADAVSQSSVQPTDVTSISISAGVLPKSELNNDKSTIVKAYPKLQKFIVSGSGSVEDNTLPANSFRESAIQEVSVAGLLIVGREAFYNCTALKTFTAPTLVEVKIGGFRFCRTLSNIDFPNLKIINNYGFMNCTYLKQLSFPLVEKVGDDAFFYDLNLTSISIPKCKHIGTEAFRETPLTSITIPEDIEYLGSYAFYYCQKLVGPLKFTKLSVLKTGTFLNCTLLIEVNAPNVIEIQNLCFRKCTSLERVIVPKVTSVGYEAFFSTPKLQDLDIPLIEILGSWSFWKSSIKTFSSSHLKNLGQQAFRDCIKLDKVTITNVKNIPRSAFSNCSAMTTIDMTNADYVSDYAFNECKNLKNIHLGDVKLVGNYSFKGCSSLDKLDSPNLEQVGNYTFLESGLKEFVSNKVVYIGDFAFQNCKELEKVYIPATCTHIGFSLFWECKKLSNCTILGNVDTSNCPNILKDTSLKYFHFSNNISNLVFTPNNEYVGIVSQVNGFCPKEEEYSVQKHVTVISAGAFKGCANIKKMTIEESVKTINSNAFEGCSLVKDLKFPHLVETAGDGLFINCVSLETLTIESPLKKLGKDCFTGCTDLKTITVPSTLEECLSTVRAECKVLMTKKDGKCPANPNFNIPNFVTHIDKDAFLSCEAVQTIKCGTNVVDIGINAFFKCAALEKFEFAAGAKLLHIDDYAFAQTNLKEITLPEKLSTVGAAIFTGSKQLQTIYVYPAFDLDRYKDHLISGTTAKVVVVNAIRKLYIQTKSSPAAIIGISIGCCALVALVILFAVIKKNGKKDQEEVLSLANEQTYTA